MTIKKVVQQFLLILMTFGVFFTVSSTAHESADITALAWSPDGQLLATGDEDGQIEILNSETGQVMLSLDGADEKIYTMAWRHDAQQLAASGKYTAWVWDAMSGQLLGTLSDVGAAFTHNIIWTTNNTEIIIDAYDAEFSSWNAETFELLDRSGSDIRSIRLNPDKTLVGYGCTSFLAFSDPQGLLSSIRFDLERTQPIFTQRLEYGGSYYAIAWSLDGRLLAGGGNGNLIIWDVIGDEIIFNIEAFTDEETFIPDRGFSDKFIRDVVFSGDDRYISMIARQGIFRTWDVDSGELVAETFLPVISTAAFSPDGTRLAYAIMGEGSDLQVLPVPSINTPPTADAGTD